MEAYVDALIAKFAAAQEVDGYLYTARTIDPANAPEACGPERWSNLGVNHELYNVGHMYEAAVAWYEATGKRDFLEVALKNADLIDSVFGEGKLRDVPGHQQIELGLTRLYRSTGDAKYLRLAKFFLDERGSSNDRELYGPYCQDHLPAIQQREAVGHAVRAGYQYAAMADIAALCQDADYAAAAVALWDDVVGKKMALTGGIGARHEGEAFGDAYELPSLTAYNETCAAQASLYWKSAPVLADRRVEIYGCVGAHALQRLPGGRGHGWTQLFLCESAGLRWRISLQPRGCHDAPALVWHGLLPDQCGAPAAGAGGICVCPAR